MQAQAKSGAKHALCLGGLLAGAAALALSAALGRARQNAVNAAAIAASGDGDNWLSHGRTYDEQRFSP
jgi:alcohol dehydrogenase (cytochrome c)/quinohemoprotein ethanol dehydrogenase